MQQSPTKARKELNTTFDLQEMRKLVESGKLKTKEIAEILNIDRTTVWRNIQKIKDKEGPFKAFKNNKADILLDSTRHSLMLDRRVTNYFLDMSDSDFDKLTTHQKIQLKSACNAAAGTMFDKHTTIINVQGDVQMNSINISESEAESLQLKSTSDLAVKILDSAGEKSKELPEISVK